MLTSPLGFPCGGNSVNISFKRWLRRQIAERHYKLLDPTILGPRMVIDGPEGNQMRLIMKRFDEKKRSFSNTPHEIHLELPEPLHDLNIRGRVTQGELRITWYSNLKGAQHQNISIDFFYQGRDEKTL